MGVTAAAFVLVIALTGILLNHTEDFQFDSHYVKTDWILDRYGIHAPDKLLSFQAGGRYITLMGDDLYLDRQEIRGEYRDLVGAVYLRDIFVVAVSNSIVLLTPRGEIIERLSGKDGAPASVRRIGLDKQNRVVTQGSLDYYQADNDFIRWQHWQQDPASARWAQPDPLDPRLQQSLQQHYRGEVLPVERVILDLHSGRFFGPVGPWVFDIAAVLLILLALSGTWIWLKRRH